MDSNTNSQPTQPNTQQIQQPSPLEQSTNNENPIPENHSLPPQQSQPPQEKKKINKGLLIALCIIVPIIFIIIIVAILFIIVFNNNDSMTCEANYGNSNISITLYFNNKQLVGYSTINMEYDYDEQQGYAQKIGVQNYLQEFNQNFKDDYDGSCKINAPHTEFILNTYSNDDEYEDNYEDGIMNIYDN